MYGKPYPPKLVSFMVDVTYSPAPNPGAVDEALKRLNENTYDEPTEIPGLGDAAFWIGAPSAARLYVFRGGTMTLYLSGARPEQLKVLALKVLGGPGKTGYVYGTPHTPMSKPVLARLGARPSQLDQLKQALTAKAEAGDARAQLALGKLYQFGTLGADGSAKPDYTAAAYWYQQASDHGEAEAAYQLAVIYRDGLGLPANAPAALDLFWKAARAGFVPAMVPLSDAYMKSTMINTKFNRPTGCAVKLSVNHCRLHVCVR